MTTYNIKSVCEGRIDHLLKDISRTAKQTGAAMKCEEIHAMPHNGKRSCNSYDCSHFLKCKYEKRSKYTRPCDLRGYSLKLVVQ